MVQYNRFFIFFDNLNFYKHIQGQCFYNKKYQLNYITGLIRLMDIGINRQSFNANTKNLNKGAKIIFSK